MTMNGGRMVRNFLTPLTCTHSPPPTLYCQQQLPEIINQALKRVYIPIHVQICTHYPGGKEDWVEGPQEVAKASKMIHFGMLNSPGGPGPDPGQGPGFLLLLGFLDLSIQYLKNATF